MAALSGAQRQRRWRMMRVKEVEALRKELARAKARIAKLEAQIAGAKKAKAKRRAWLE